jgi:endonuclease/exonuclease/phosphatase family metal-dependent hydrolase
MSYRLATFNVHNFLNEELEKTKQPIFQLIQEYDIVCLQEVYDEKVCSELTKVFPYSFYNESTMILSLYPIKGNIPTKKTNEHFCASLIQFPQTDVFVVNVHLDYECETKRIHEINQIFHYTKPYLNEYPVILAGDFNALTKQDYTTSQWKQIYKLRKHSQWELPVHKLTDKLNQSWIDSGKEYVFQKTCRYNTRVDYIYTNCIAVKHYEVKETIPYLSDHNLVFISFTI